MTRLELKTDHYPAMAAGSARPEDVAELARLLPAVFEAAESTDVDDADREAVAYIPGDASDTPLVQGMKLHLRLAYTAGALRLGRR